MDGFPAPWWISGGWAIEAFTGASRSHDDVDVTIFRRDVAALRAHFAGRFDLWAAGSGQLRPINERRPDVPRWMGQVWMREHALAPWQLDVLLNSGSSPAMDLQARPQRDPSARRGDLGRRQWPALSPARARARPQGRAQPTQGRCRSCRRPAAALGSTRGAGSPRSSRGRRRSTAGGPCSTQGRRVNRRPSPRYRRSPSGEVERHRCWLVAHARGSVRSRRPPRERSGLPSVMRYIQISLDESGSVPCDG